MRLVVAFTAFCSIALTGCSLTSTQPTSTASGASIQGKVHGGQQPISGAHVYLLAANTTGYGGSGMAASATNASISLLSATSTGLSDSVGAYVLTGPDGSFSISGDYTCTANTQVYAYALGGNPGAGTNSAAGLLAILGACPSSGVFPSSTYVWINEVSTIAAAYSFAGFATDATHVSSSGTALAITGISNAFANAANLVGQATGTAATANVANTGTVPQTEINTLANILASCVNSTGAVTGPTNPTPCYTLFNNAQSAGSSGTIPTDTATAAINIAHNPGSNIAALYGIPTPAAAFAPALTAQPNDFTLAITITQSLPQPYQLAIDASGNVWVTNGSTSTVAEFTNSGSLVSVFSQSTNGIVEPTGIAIDLSGDAWVSNFVLSSVSEIAANGTNLSGTNGYRYPALANGLTSPNAIAIDASGDAWVANQQGTNLIELSPSGANISGTNGYRGTGLNNPYALAFDAAGNIWTANYGSNTVTKLVPSGNGTDTSTQYAVGGINQPYGVAIDSTGNIWVANRNNSVSELSSSGTAISPSGGYTGGGLSLPQFIAIDGAGNAWITNYNAALAEFSNSGTAITPTTGYLSPSMLNPVGVAIDPSGNVWVTNGDYSTSLTEFIGAAVPVVTPLVAAVKNNTIASRP